ncbi:MAG: exosortase-associated EpsI family protein [Thermoguttaceae bacterium]
MNRSYVLLGIVVAFGLTIFSGVLQGRMRNRWGTSPDTVRAADKLAEVPSQFGDWKLSSTGKLGETAERMLECTGSFVREYRDQTTNDVVSVTVLLGPPGPISVHTPEICFRSTGFSAMGERKELAIRGEDRQNDQFWALSYKANDVRGGVLRVYYAWSTGRRWAASGDPRFKYADKPYLYKIQISSLLPPGADLQADDPGKKFLRSVLPVARKCMIEPSDGN